MKPSDAINDVVGTIATVAAIVAAVAAIVGVAAASLTLSRTQVLARNCFAIAVGTALAALFIKYVPQLLVIGTGDVIGIRDSLR